MMPANPLPAQVLALDDLQGIEAGAQRHEVPCGDGAMVWHSWGEGAPVVLLHGGSGSWTHWVRNIAALVGAGHQAWIPDLPGFGDSARPPFGGDADALPGPMEAALQALLGDALGATVRGFRVVEARTTATAERRPVTLACQVAGTELPPAEQVQALRRAVAAYFERRLLAMEYQEPRDRLSAHKDELLALRQRAMAEQSRLEARALELERQLAQQRRRSDELDQQRLAVRVELATEAHALEHLQGLQAELGQRRDHLRSQRDSHAQTQREIRREVEALQREINQYSTAGDVAKVQPLLERLRGQEPRLRSLEDGIDRCNEQLADVQAMLAHVLDKLPAGALAVQRAKARQTALDQVAAEVAKLADELAGRQREAEQEAGRLDRLRFELEASRQQVLDLQQRLDRLQPIRVRAIG